MLLEYSTEVFMHIENQALFHIIWIEEQKSERGVPDTEGIYAEK